MRHLTLVHLDLNKVLQKLINNHSRDEEINPYEVDKYVRAPIVQAMNNTLFILDKVKNGKSERYSQNTKNTRRQRTI
jgi:hypothetical protein